MNGTKKWYQSGAIMSQVISIVVMLIALTVGFVNSQAPGTVTADEQAVITGSVQQAGDAVVAVTSDAGNNAVVGGWGALAAAVASIVMSIIAIWRRKKATTVIAPAGKAGVFPKSMVLFLLLLMTIAVAGCGSMGGFKISLSPDLCLSVEVMWDDTKTTVEDVCLDEAPVDDVQLVKDVAVKLGDLASQRGRTIIGVPVIKDIVRSGR